jgi:hypothetical protein
VTVLVLEYQIPVQGTTYHPRKLLTPEA